MEMRKAGWGLLQRKEGWGLSRRGWLVLLLSGLVALYLGFAHANSFLAPTQPVEAEYLVVEGWTPDYVMETAIKEFNARSYKKLLTTGCPMPAGYFLSEYGSYAQIAAATLGRLGLGSNAVVAVPSPEKYRNRTYHEALALNQWFHTQGLAPRAVNLVTLGAHARRSQLMYALALPGIRVGIIAVEDREYDPQVWWKSSAGVRGVIGEWIAYVYARFLFHPTRPSPV